MNIDIHAHFVPGESLKVASDIGKRHGMKLGKNERVREIVSRDGKPFLSQLKAEFFDLDLRLSIMDSQGVDMQALSPASSYFFYWMAAEESLEYAQWLNERLAEAAAKHPTRLVALGSVPMQDSAKAVGELERAVTKLGLRGVEIATNINGRYFDDPGFNPFWEAAQALDALIFVHPNQVVGADRMKAFNLANLIGNPTDTSLAFAKLIFSGVLERYPRLRFLLAHGGGFLPYTWGRLDRGYRIQDSAAAKIPKAPGEYVKLLNFDTITHSTMALEYLVANFGADHVVLGSDYPYDMGDPEPVASLRAARIDHSSLEQIASANACKLLGIGI
ncbi:MAG TPA: amidohydrolase family protein [Candidatus Binatia bacterium]|nr:amidohydrolase family protein [Candidatus Binatia bacterium]